MHCHTWSYRRRLISPREESLTTEDTKVSIWNESSTKSHGDLRTVPVEINFNLLQVKEKILLTSSFTFQGNHQRTILKECLKGNGKGTQSSSEEDKLFPFPPLLFLHLAGIVSKDITTRGPTYKILQGAWPLWLQLPRSPDPRPLVIPKGHSAARSN